MLDGSKFIFGTDFYWDLVAVDASLLLYPLIAYNRPIYIPAYNILLCYTSQTNKIVSMTEAASFRFDKELLQKRNLRACRVTHVKVSLG